MQKDQDPVVRKPIKANLRLKCNRGFHLAHYSGFFKANFKLMLKPSISQELRDKSLGPGYLSF